MSAHSARQRRVPWKSSIRFSFQIFFQHVDQFLGRLGLLGVGLDIWINHMKADVPFEHFADKAGQCASAGDQNMKQVGAISLPFERPLYSIDLTPKTPNPIEEFFLIPDSMSHEPLYHTHQGISNTHRFRCRATEKQNVLPNCIASGRCYSSPSTTLTGH